MSPRQQVFSPHSTSTTKSTTRIFLSDVPRDPSSSSQDDNNNKEKNNNDPILLDWKAYLPPPPEDQFIMTGDIAILFVYGFSSHFINNFVVESVMANSNTIQDALGTLDPLGEVVSLTQHPVWVQPEFRDSVLTIHAQQTLMDHWGPLYSTAGSACVALCSSWLLAGWWRGAFLFQNSVDCDTTRALQKTFETWVSMMVFMVMLSLTSNSVVEHVPILREWLGCASCADFFILTKADAMFVIDSATVLIAWRFMANTIANWFR